MNEVRKIGAIVLAISLLLTSVLVYADGESSSNSVMETMTQLDDTLLSDISAKSAIVVETNTGTILCEKNASEQQSISHLAKLMTLLITMEKIEASELLLEDLATTSAHANSMGGTQIWLNVGEKISVNELIKSITIGNANDACVVLAEKIAGSEEEFVLLMNERAKQLKMENTHFSDCTGISIDTISTAEDLAILAECVVKFDTLTECSTTWIDTVRNKATELVNTNRMVRTYKGITGLKSCSSQESGECLISTVTRGEMSLCVVVLDSSSSDNKFSEAKKALDGSFEKFEIYTPEIDKKVFEKVKVVGGEKSSIGVKTANLTPVVIERGTYSSITCEFERVESLTAPILENQKLGTVTFYSGDTILLEGEIQTKKQVNKIGMKFSLKKVLLNLLNM